MPGFGFWTSSFLIVPVAVDLPSDAFTGPDSSSVNVSSASKTVSPMIETEIDFLVSPGPNVSVPVVAT